MQGVSAAALPLENAEAEALLCGALMCEARLIDQAADVVRQEDFASEFYGHLFGLIVQEHGLGRAPTPVTLRQHYDEAGWRTVAALTGNPSAVLSAMDCAHQVADLGKRRRFVEKMQAVLVSASYPDQTVESLASEAEDAISEATRDQDGVTEVSAGGAARKALEAIGRADPGMRTGIDALDEAQGPIRRKNLAILAGRPGMGKTAVALRIAKGVARRQCGVLLISLEMSDEELGERMLADEAFIEGEYPDQTDGVRYSDIVEGRVDRNSMRRLVTAQEAIDKLPLEIVDIGSLRTSKLNAMVRRWKRRFAARGTPLGLVVVDYLQLLTADGKVNGQYEAITAISKALKGIAKNNDVGVLALAQLSRKVEERDDKRPRLSDLRDSGQIEQDADMVTFLLREEYYLRAVEPAEDSPKYDAWRELMAEAWGKIDFICAKRRKGAAGVTQGRFFGAYQAVRG